ncbi:C39 family peptidase [Treponema sp.]|uniref:C39 family peptidase n=1 Tax=Treponema sp. TaxID=166 RepID=UPI003F09D9FD
MSNKSEEFYKRNLAVPFFTQRDNTYVWQQREKDDSVWVDKNGNEGPKYPMAWRTCNITSLCMILHYWGLTEETPNQMLEKVFSKPKEGEKKNAKWGWLYEKNDDSKYLGARR